MALQNLPSPLCEECGRVFAFLAPRHPLAIVEIVAANPRAVAGQVPGRGREKPAPESDRSFNVAGAINVPVVIHTSCQRAKERVETFPGGQTRLPAGKQEVSRRLAVCLSCLLHLFEPAGPHIEKTGPWKVALNSYAEVLEPVFPERRG